MRRKLLEVTTLHGLTIDELITLEESYQKKFLKALLRTVIMRYNGGHTEEIQHILGKSRPTITGYINKWNEYGLDALVDNCGGSVSTFTDDMIEDLKDTVVVGVLIGQPPAIERNGTRKGVNIIGATEVSKNFDSVVNVYSSDVRITSNEIIKFLRDLLDINKDKNSFYDLGQCKNSHLKYC